MERVKRKLIEIEGEDNQFTVSSPMKKKAATEFSTQKNVFQGSLEEGEIPDKITKGCSSQKMNRVYPNDRTVFYGPSILHHESLKLKLNHLRNKYENLQIGQEVNVKFIKFWKKQLHEIDGNIKYCLGNFGLWCAYKVVQIYIENGWIGNATEWAEDWDNEVLRGTEDIKDDYLSEVLKTMEDAFPLDIKNCEIMKAGNIFGVEEGLLTPKIHALLRCLLSWEYEGMSCVVIMESILAYVAISSLMEGFDYFGCGNIHRDHLFGSISGSKMKQRSPKNIGFREVDVVFTTDINIKKYNYVIHFNIPNTIQNMYNQEVDQNEPAYIVLLERGNKGAHDLFYDLVMREYLAFENNSILSGESENVFGTNPIENMENEATSSLYMITKENELYINSSSPSDEAGKNFETGFNSKIDENDEAFSDFDGLDILYGNLQFREDEGGNDLEKSYNVNIEGEDFGSKKAWSEEVGSEDIFPTQMTWMEKNIFSYSNSKEDEGGYNFEKSYNDNIRSEEVRSEEHENEKVGSENVFPTQMTKMENNIPSYSISKEDDGKNFISSDKSEPNELWAYSGSKEFCVSLGTARGVPRASLHEMSRRMRWAKPIFRMLKKDGTNHNPKFVYSVELKVPNKKLSVTGEEKKKSDDAKDSAALLMLHELEKHGFCRKRFNLK